MAAMLTQCEMAVLKAFVSNEEQDHEGAWQWFHASIVKAMAESGGKTEDTDNLCRGLRRKKYLVVDGAGKMASYYPSDKGREAGAAMNDEQDNDAAEAQRQEEARQEEAARLECQMNDAICVLMGDHGYTRENIEDIVKVTVFS